VSHLTRLGIVVMDDGGLLFGLALVVFVCSAIVAFIRLADIPIVGARLSVAVSSAAARAQRSVGRSGNHT